MKQPFSLRSLSSSLIMAAGLVLVPAGAAYAVDAGVSTNTHTTTTQSTETEKTSTESTSGKSTTAADTLAQRLTNVIAKGDQEIARRQTELSKLNTKIAAANHLTASDKATLTSQVTAESAGLSALKTKLDSEKTLDAAHADAKLILSDYRVYALIVPKIALIRTADNEQATATRLTELATKLQTRITASSKASDLQKTLDDMIAQTKTAQTTASAIEAKVINLQPTDFNGDHAILGGNRDQLKTAHTAIQAAIADAKTIIAALKTN